MQFWNSCEAEVDVADPLRYAGNDIEDKLNEALSTRSYGDGVVEWAIIFIMLSQDDPNYCEIQRFHKKRKVVEFRLKVDHAKFKSGTEIEQRQLLSAAILRSFRLTSKMKLDDFDQTKYESDVCQVLTSHGWVG